MKIESKKLEKNQLELTIEVSLEELRPFLERAAARLSERTKIAGFRPGKAPYQILKQQVGEMAIYEEALEEVVRSTFTQAVKEQKIETVSQPQIEIVKLAPDNPLVYKATVALMPRVTLGDYKSLRIKRKKVEIKDEEIAKALKEMGKMQTKEVLAGHPVEKGSKVVLDMEMFLDKVPVEGGQAKGHAVYMDEDYFIPGFNEKIVGQKKGETREFVLKFPQEHYQKNLAGKDVEFKVTVREIYDLIPPKLDDEFAKSLGQKSLGDLKKILGENLKNEAVFREDQRVEREMLEEVVKQSEFEEIPEVLLKVEVEKMIRELRDGVSRQGMKFEDYLANILKKKAEELQQEFLPEAENRVKTALVMRSLAITEKVEANNEEIEAETKKMLEAYKDSEEMQNQIRSAGGREYLSNLIRNRKIIALLKKEIVVES